MSSDDALATALRWAEVTGWPVGFVRADKTPYPGTHGFKDFSTDPDTIRKTHRPGSKPATAVPSGHVAVDLDPGADLGALDLPPTLSQETPRGGRHLVYSTGDADVRPAVGVVPHVDLRGPGSYILLYGFDDAPVAPVPAWVREASAARRDVRFEDVETVPEGERESFLVSMAGSLRAVGLTANETHAAISKANDQRCDPPLDARDVARIARSAATWERGEVVQPITVRLVKRATADDVPITRPLSEVERIPPEPLVDGFAHPTNHTILYGPNGKGKGVFAAWKIAARTRAGEVVMLLDYEGHIGEWRARLEDMKGDLSKVHIALPFGFDGGYLKGSIWEQQDELREEADRVEADWVYVDSISVACGIQDVTEATAPGPYFGALNAIGRPSVSLGHVTKVEDLKYPFGSMLWRAYVRMAWSFSGEGSRRELVNRKTNDYPQAESLTFDWSWSAEMPPGRVPESLEASAAGREIGARAFEAIGEDEVSSEELLARVNDDGFPKIKIGTLKNKVSDSSRFEQRRRGLWRRVPPVSVRLVSAASDELVTKPSDNGSASQ